MNFYSAMTEGDALSVTLSLVLLAMSVASWAVIVYKAWLLRRVSADLSSGKAAFWQARDLTQGLSALSAIDRMAVLIPLAQAHQQLMPGTLGAHGDVAAQRTRVLRDALHGVLHRLQSGQVLLATVGSTAPFVGLLGTVWGIYHALTGIATAGQLTIERVAGPVGEALIMTAAGLAVALPAVLARSTSWDVSSTAWSKSSKALPTIYGRCDGLWTFRAYAGPNAHERHQRHTPGRCDDGLAGHFHHHGTLDGQRVEAGFAQDRRCASQHGPASVDQARDRCQRPGVDG